MMDYSQIDGLNLFYFEDSWVLDVVARPGLLTIDLDAVLLPAHPEYVAPSPGEQYCYRRGELRLEGVADLQWIGQGLPPARDATGEFDYGWGGQGLQRYGVNLAVPVGDGECGE